MSWVSAWSRSSMCTGRRGAFCPRWQGRTSRSLHRQSPIATAASFRSNGVGDGSACPSARPAHALARLAPQTHETCGWSLVSAPKPVASLGRGWRSPSPRAPARRAARGAPAPLAVRNLTHFVEDFHDGGGPRSPSLSLPRKSRNHLSETGLLPCVGMTDALRSRESSNVSWMACCSWAVHNLCVLLCNGCEH